MLPIPTLPADALSGRRRHSNISPTPQNRPFTPAVTVTKLMIVRRVRSL